MKFVERVLGRKVLKTAWTYSSRGIIWRLYPGDARFLAGEDRDIGRKTTTFFSLDRLTGKEIWSRKKFVDDWWVGVEALSAGKLVLHGFAAPDMPLHMGMMVVDLASGQELWNRPEWVFAGLKGSTVIAFQGPEGGGSFSSFDLSSGEVLESLKKSSLGQNNGKEIESPDIVFPVSTAEKGLNNEIAEFCRSKDVEGPLEYAAYGEIDIIAYRAQRKDGSGKLLQLLSAVRRGDPNELWSEIISSEASGFVPDSFFIQSGMLYFVKEQKSLLAVNLHEYSKSSAGGS